MASSAGVFLPWTSVGDMLVSVLHPLSVPWIREFMLKSTPVEYARVFASLDIDNRCIPYQIELTSASSQFSRVIFNNLSVKVMEHGDFSAGFSIRNVSHGELIGHQSVCFRKYISNKRNNTTLVVGLTESGIEVTWFYSDCHRVAALYLTFESTLFYKSVPLNTLPVSYEMLESGIGQMVVSISTISYGQQSVLGSSNRHMKTYVLYDAGPWGNAYFETRIVNQNTVSNMFCGCEGRTYLPKAVRDHLKTLAVQKIMRMFALSPTISHSPTHGHGDARTIPAYELEQSSILPNQEKFNREILFAMTVGCVNENIEGLSFARETDMGNLLDGVIEKATTVATQTSVFERKILPRPTLHVEEAPQLTEKEAKALRRKLQKRESAYRSYLKKKVRNNNAKSNRRLQNNTAYENSNQSKERGVGGRDLKKPSPLT